MAGNTQNNCPCVGSMGLHQNNVANQSSSNLSKVGFQFAQFSNRSVIDVFRGIRDRYFSKPKSESTSHGAVQELKEIDEDEDGATINSLPACCKLLILSLLDTCDICRVSCVSSHWRDVANDQILWRELLLRDMCKWDSMTNKSHPLIPQFWKQELVGNEPGFDSSFIPHSQNSHNPEIPENDDISGSPILKNDDSAPKQKKDIHANNGINYKALYIHSSYQRCQDDSEGTSNHRIPDFLMSFLTSGVEEQGEVIMTGPGMDSPRTSLIFRSLMWGSGFMETKGLLPGNRDGIGSGVLVLFREKITFKLIALYSGNNRVRERRFGMARLLESNVVEAVPRPSEGNNEEAPRGENWPVFDFVLHEAVHQYFADRSPGYKLVYLVDSTAGLSWEDLSCNRLELQAILRGTQVVGEPENLTPQEPAQDVNIDLGDSPSPNFTHKVPPCAKRPLLVFSCVASPDIQRIPSVQVTAMLNLPSVVDRAWRVQDVTVSTMEGVEKGLEWLLKQP